MMTLFPFQLLLIAGALLYNDSFCQKHFFFKDLIYRNYVTSSSFMQIINREQLGIFYFIFNSSKVNKFGRKTYIFFMEFLFISLGKENSSAFVQFKDSILPLECLSSSQVHRLLVLAQKNVLFLRAATLRNSCIRIFVSYNFYGNCILQFR